jgi:protein gp37
VNSNKSILSRQRYRNLRGKSLKKSRTWVMEKKERWRNKGRHVINLNKDHVLNVFFNFILEMFDPIQNTPHENVQKLFKRFFFVCVLLLRLLFRQIKEENNIIH